MQKNNKKMIFIFYNITIANSEKINLKFLGGFNIDSFDKDFSEKDCSLTEFNDEYLFCCGIKDKI